MRSPAARRGTRSAIRAASLCWWYERSRASIPWRSRRTRVCRVSSQRTVSARGQLVENAQGDVGEVSDRRRADRERHALPHSVERLVRDERRADQACLFAELGLDDLQRLVGGLNRLRAGRDSRAGPSTRSPAAAPKPPPMMTTSGSKMFDERADRGAEHAADLGQRVDRRGVARRAPARRARARPRPVRTARRPPDPRRARTRAPRDARARGSSPGTAGRRRRRRRARARPSRGRGDRRSRPRRRRRCRA